MAGCDPARAQDTLRKDLWASQAVAVYPVLHGRCSLGLLSHPTRLFLVLEPCRELKPALITERNPGSCRYSVPSELQESLAAA